MNMDTLTTNILTIAAEVLVLVFALVALNWVAGRFIGSVISVPALKRFEGGAKILRRNLRLTLALAGLLLVTSAIAANLYLMHRGENLAEYTLGQIKNIPRSFWIELGISAAKVVGLLIVTAVVIKLVRRAIDGVRERAKAFEGIKANDESIHEFFVALERLLVRGVWLFFLAWSARLLNLPPAVPDTILIVLKIYLIIATGLLCWRGLGAFIDSVDALSKKYADEQNLLRVYDRLQHLVPLFRKSVEYVIYVTVATLVVMQVSLVASFAEWGPRLIRVIGVVFLGRVAVELSSLLVEHALITRAQLTPSQKQRRETLVPLVQSILKYGIYFCVGVIVLKLVGVNPTPVLAGAGIAGLAVGLGAQNLINDVVSGFFILFEEHYLLGDFIKSGEAEGRVEAIDLRTTRIRDNSGRLHILRNGQIGDVINYSKNYTHAVVEVGVAYESDLDKVLSVLEAVGERLHESREDVLEPTMIKGLDAFGESEMVVRTVTKVKPGRHLQVERHLRKILKEAFDEHGIEIPYARRVLIMKNPLESPKEVDVNA